MIISQDVKKYLDDLYELPVLGQMYSQNREAYPIIPKDTALFLVNILHLKQPTLILEIGTCIGFSAALMAQTLKNAHITTIERYPLMIEKAKENFAKLKLTDRITLLEGNAPDILKNLQGGYDLIFLDGGKAQYINFLPRCLRLLKCDGVLIADNILQKGCIAKDISEIEKRQRTIYNNMRKFLEDITKNQELSTVILPIGDGLSFSVKKEKP